MVRVKPLNMKRMFGYTLIELMIVVAAIGILAALSYPSFHAQVIKTHRTDGKDALLRAAALEQRWYTDNNSYTSDLNNVGGSNSPERHYVLTISVGDISGTTCDTSSSTNNNCFILTATPQAGQAEDVCANLILDSLGRKTVSGAGNCW